MSLRKQASIGVKWTSLSTITLAVIGIVKISVLARLLDASDFGLMALIMFVIGFMDLFNDMGISTAILHRSIISKVEYASLYWLNVLFSIFLYLVCLGLTPLMANFYEQPELFSLIPLISLNLIITAIGRQFKVIEQKHLLFKQISLIDITSGVLSLIVAIVLAVNGFGVFSLIYSLLFQSLISNIFYLIIGMNKHGLLFRFCFSDTKPFLKIGVYQVGGQVINYFNSNIDIILIGKFFSRDILGGYSLAKQLVMRPTQILNPILTKVASPVLALFQEDLSLLKVNYLKLINILSTISIPTYLAIIVFAPFLVNVLYGHDFQHIVILVRILSVYMMFRSLWSPISSLVVATGKTDLEFKWSLVALMVFPLFIVFGSRYGIVEVTISIVLSMVILFVPSWKYLIFKMTGASLKEYIYSIIKWDFNYILKNIKISKK